MTENLIVNVSASIKSFFFFLTHWKARDKVVPSIMHTSVMVVFKTLPRYVKNNIYLSLPRTTVIFYVFCFVSFFTMFYLFILFLNFKILWLSPRKWSLSLGTIAANIDDIHLNDINIMSVPAFTPNIDTCFRTKTFNFWSSRFLVDETPHVTRRWWWSFSASEYHEIYQITLFLAFLPKEPILMVSLYWWQT